MPTTRASRIGNARPTSRCSDLMSSSVAPVLWDHLTWPEIGALVASRPTEIALLPVGATEQHGPHLPTGTDTIIATLLCDQVSQRTGALVLPALSLGASFG